MNVLAILNELRNTSSINQKIEILTQNKDNLELKDVLKSTYDNINYYVTSKNLQINWKNNSLNFSLSYIINKFKSELATRNVTGNNALSLVEELLNNAESQEIVDTSLLILDRDLKLGLGKTLINKVWKDLVKDTPYMRCGVFSEKLSKKINFPAICQLKADGRFTYAIKNDNEVIFESRSGELTEFPLLKNEFLKLADGVYVGELLVKNISDRTIANGLINSLNPPHEAIYMKCWDMVKLDEYADARHETKIPRENYQTRWENLSKELIHVNQDKLSVIDSVEVNSVSEALVLTSKWMNDGYEGSILKDTSLIFKDHTSNQQLKLKVEIELEVRITGFIEGKKGTKRENTFGSITFKTDDNKIVGSTSGFSDKLLKEFNEKRQELIGKVMAVKCNDILKANSDGIHSLSHPRFVELRDDKDYTDTLERSIELKQLSLMLKNNE